MVLFGQGIVCASGKVQHTCLGMVLALLLCCKMRGEMVKNQHHSVLHESPNTTVATVATSSAGLHLDLKQYSTPHTHTHIDNSQNCKPCSNCGKTEKLLKRQPRVCPERHLLYKAVEWSTWGVSCFACIRPTPPPTLIPTPPPTSLARAIILTCEGEGGGGGGSG